MADASVITYVNHLKKAYSVRSGENILAITDTSCYHLAEETAWLTAQLPEAALKDGYLRSLAGLGLNEPRKIFNKLVSLGALQEKEKRSWKDILRILLTPQIKLISAQLQERFFNLFINGPAVAGKTMQILAAGAAAGFLWATLLLFIGPGKTLTDPLAGKASGLVVVSLVILGSLLHELGHSFAAMASGIGLRPIGFSVYLIYPVFYTNVSGIEKVGLAKRALIDCGGFVFQGVFLFLLLLLCSFTGSPALAEAARWIVVIVFFNLNPLFRTDGYWLYKDAYSEFKTNRWARALHYLYLVAFIAFSAWFLWRVCGRMEDIWRGFNTLFHSPGYFLSGGYRIVLGAYFILIGFFGGLRRFQEGHQEWVELRKKLKGNNLGEGKIWQNPVR